MNLFSLMGEVTVTAPKSLWVTIINWVNSLVGNFGWTIILVVLLIKVVTTPLDFFVKLNTKKQTLVQQKCAPQIAKLQKKFGADKNSFRIQSQAIYKREGYDMKSGCLIMLINTILSLVIFITFYTALRKVSAYEAIYQYEQIETNYSDAFYTSMANNSADFDDKKSAITWWKTFTENEAKVNAGTATEDETTAYNTSKAYYDANKDTLFQTATEDASKAAVDYWNANKGPSSWLWVQNIWVADSTAKPFPLYSTLQSNAKSTGYSEYVDAINEDSYNRIATIIIENSPRANNGYYILAVLAGVITFAAQYITELHTKLKNKKANALAKAAGNETASSMKMLKIIMPIIMVVFVLTTSASFGLYILSSNVSSILLGELTTLAVDKLTKNKRIEVEASLEKEANKLIKKGRL